MKKKSAAYVTSAFLLVGCASHPDIVPIGMDTFMISRSAHPAVKSLGALKAEAFKEANEYCIRQNKVFQAVKMESRPVAPFVVPEAELQFMCLKPGDADITRPKLKKEADTIIEVITPAR